MALSPLPHFTSTAVRNCPQSKTPSPATCHLGVEANVLLQCKKCTLMSTQAVLLARPALHRNVRAMGSFLRQAHNSTRSRGPSVTRLAYW